MVCREKNIFLQQGRLNLVILNEHIFPDSLDRIQLLGDGVLGEINTPKSTSADFLENLEALEGGDLGRPPRFQD